jgi:Fe-S cluster assembly protein SufD
LIEVLPGHELTLTSHFLCQRSSLLSKIQILLREGARLNWVCIQNNSKQSLHVDQIEIIAEEESSGHAFFVNSGSRMSRQNVRLTFAQKKSGFKIHGLCLADGDQHFDVSTVIEHLKGENFSEQIFKSVLGGRAKSVFSGLVYIEKDAQLAHSSQLNKSLLLSRGAEAISQPQLEIYADDVKATHGSTVGQIQSEEIFYLRSRAISEPEAISLLCEGFASELVFSISDVDQKNYLLNFLKSRVRELRA